MDVEKEYTIPKIELELKEITKYVYSALNYKVEDYEARKSIVDNIQSAIGEQLNAHLFFCTESNLNDYKIVTIQQCINNLFEIMSEYLLNAKDVVKEKEYKYYSQDKLKDGSARKCISLEGYIADIMTTDNNIYKHYDDINNATYRIEDFADEIYNVDFVRDYMEYNKIARNVIQTCKLGDKEFSEKEISVLKRAIGYCKNNSVEIDKDIIALYKMYKGFIYFKQPLKETTQPSYDSFDFSNIGHIIALLKFRGEGNFDSDIGCLVYELNRLIENTELTKNERNILNLYRDIDATIDDIAKDIGVSKQYISEKLQVICKKISNQFLIEYEDWYFTYIEKGEYQRCSICGQIKLANENYFGINKRNKSGFNHICKECRK